MFCVACSTGGSIALIDQLDALSSGLLCHLLTVSGQAACPSWPAGELLGPAECPRIVCQAYNYHLKASFRLLLSGHFLTLPFFLENKQHPFEVNKLFCVGSIGCLYSVLCSLSSLQRHAGTCLSTQLEAYFREYRVCVFVYTHIWICIYVTHIKLKAKVLYFFLATCLWIWYHKDVGLQRSPDKGQGWRQIKEKKGRHNQDKIDPASQRLMIK